MPKRNLVLIPFRYLEKALGYRYTYEDILAPLREMNFLAVADAGYIPAYTRTELTDALHEAFSFRTDYQIVSQNR